jgi:hypothetical protein
MELAADTKYETVQLSNLPVRWYASRYGMHENREKGGLAALKQTATMILRWFIETLMKRFGMMPSAC